MWAHGMWTDGQPWPANLSAEQAQGWLRDPAIYEEAGRVYLLYSACGEQGIALAEVHFTIAARH
jgi:hypothetical protein